MIDVREQIFEKLKSVESNTKMTLPEGNFKMPLLTYGEISNVPIGKWHDRLEFQVDAYASSFVSVLELATAASDAMKELGFTRTYITPDAKTREKTGRYHKAMSFVAEINTNENNVFGGI